MVIKLSHAFLISLLDQGAPVISEYDLYLTLWKLYGAKTFKGEPLGRVRKPHMDRTRYYNIIKEFRSKQILRPDLDFLHFEGQEHLNKNVSSARFVLEHAKDKIRRVFLFRLAEVSDGSAEDIICLADPFSYVSHLSAMERYGLTNRSPEKLIVTRPSPTLWTHLRNEKELADYGKSREEMEYRPSLLKLGLPDTIRARPIQKVETSKIRKSIQIRNSFTRITSIGDVFLEMLDRPELCGGMGHVLEVWDTHASNYLEEIIKAFDADQEKLLKVRAGYLLDQRLNIKDSRINHWLNYAQRGGSQKLDSSKPYSSHISEKWMLSLNV